MLKAIGVLLIVLLGGEFGLMLGLEQLGFSGLTEVWIKPLVDASVMAFVAALASYWVLPWATGDSEHRREKPQLRSALIVFGVQLMLMMLLPLLASDINPFVEALVDAFLFSVLATLGIILWVLLPEQARARRGQFNRTFTPFHSPWFTGTTCYLFGILLLSLMLLTLFKLERQEHRDLMTERQQASLSLVQGMLSHELHSNLQDVLIFSERPNLVTYVTEGWPWAAQLSQQDFDRIVANRSSYQAIRFFDNRAQLLIESATWTDEEDVGLIKAGAESIESLLRASSQMRAGEVSFVTRSHGDQPRPVEIFTPVFDQHGVHSGLLVVTLDSGHLIKMLTSAFHQPRSSLALISDGGIQWIVEVMRSGEQIDADFGLFWASRNHKERGAAYLESGLASYDSLQSTPALLGGIEGFSLKGGWPDWRLYSLLPRYDVERLEQRMIWLYLLILAVISIVAGVVGFAYIRIYIRQLEVERQLYMLAHHDPLTGLDNRALFSHKLDLELRHAQRNQTILGLLYMDLDRFKPINDEYGHDVGDAALKTVVARLRPLLRASDSFARLGGDEFAVILPEVSGQEEIEAIAGRLIAAMTPPFELLGKRCSLGISIGATWCQGEVNADVLIKHADQAMYRAKKCDEASVISNSAEAVVFFDQHCRIRESAEQSAEGL